jgi:hypothetical protein
MNVRVVRFTDVTAERIEALRARVEAEGAPPGVSANSLTVLFDESQGSAVVLQYFESAADMEEAARVLGAMDPTETPGTRASVDACEVAIEIRA